MRTYKYLYIYRYIDIYTYKYIYIYKHKYYIIDIKDTILMRRELILLYYIIYVTVVYNDLQVDMLHIKINIFS